MVSDHHKCPFDLLNSTGMKIKTVGFVIGERVPICLDATARLSLVAILGMDIPANGAIPQAPKTPGHESQHTCLQTASMLIRQTTISTCMCWHNRCLDRTYAQCAPDHSHASCTWCGIRKVTRNTSHTHSAFNSCDASERSTVHFSNQMNGSDVIGVMYEDILRSRESMII